MTTLRPVYLDDFANTRTLHSLGVFARASVAMIEDANGVWSEIAANIPRFGYDQTNGESLGLLIEGARTNSIRNPRQEGAVTGTPGTLPTNFSIANAAGLTTNVIATGTTRGIQWVRYQVVGTATGAQYVMNFESGTQIVATPSQQWACSLFYRLVSGSHGGTDHNIVSRTAAGAAVETLNIPFTGTGVLTRFGTVQTLDAGGTVARMTQGLRFTVAIGLAYDFQFEIGWPQAEAGFCVSTPILPTIGAPAAATRATETYIVPIAALEASANLPIGLIWEGRCGTGGAAQVALQVDDNTANNRFTLRREPTPTSLRAILANAGATTPVTIGTLASDGQAFRVGLSLDGLGGLRGSTNGGAVSGITGGVITGITFLRVGHSTLTTEHWFDYIARVACVQRPPSDPTLMLISA